MTTDEYLRREQKARRVLKISAALTVLGVVIGLLLLVA